jgi:hypothetical protein
MHIKLTNGKPENYSIGELRRDNPQVSFPKNPSTELLAQYFVYPLKEVERPVVNFATQNVKEGLPKLVGSTWTQTWVITNATAEESAQRLQDQSNAVRSQRNTLLAQSDWTQMPDSGVINKEDWLVYRQALRDVSKQLSFPWSVNWPVAPSI